MAVSDHLGAVVKAYPQARIVAFADLSSRMILASHGNQPVTQENLDALCEQARTSFDDPLFSLSVEAFGEPHAAMVLAQDGVRVFLRSESEPADALVCVCDHSIDLGGFVAKIRETLEKISAGT
ncbi:MAG: hypothetical protein LPJ93_00340 [Rhodobacterales bacterium]|nr:hypothetical protein [Rhodobacterales bacterium]